MADQSEFLANLAQQLAYYQGGGKDPGMRDVDKAGTIGDTITNSVKNVLAIKQAKLQQDAAQRQASPIGSYYGVPSTEDIIKQQGLDTQAQQDVQQQNQRITQNNALPVQGPPNVVPGGTDANGIPFAPSQVPPQSSPQPLVQPPQPQAPQMQAQQQDFLNKNKVPSSMPVDVLSEGLKLGALANAKYLYANPHDFSDVSVTPDATHNYPVPQKEGLHLGASNPTVAAISGQTAIDQGQVKKNTKVITPMQQGLNPYAQEKRAANILAELPSNQPATTAGGAASGVQVAARQGKTIISKAGTPQDLQLASSDLARAIQRSAPLAETLNGASYANTWAVDMNRLLQKITSNPKASDFQNIRQEMFNKFDELEKSAKPFIQRQLDQVASVREGNLPPNWGSMVKKELGEDLPPVQFNGSSQTPLDDNSAMKWALEHPLDPRAQAIKQANQR